MELIIMSKVCEICGKAPAAGRNVSHSHRVTNRVFRPNVQKITINDMVLFAVSRVLPKYPEINANLGLIALRNGDIQAAENYIAKASAANGAKEAIGNLHLAQGKYAQAEQDFNGINTNSAALTQIMNKNYNAAATTLKNVKSADGMTDYLKAIVAARTGKASDAAIALQSALAKDASLRPYAEKDKELKK